MKYLEIEPFLLCFMVKFSQRNFRYLINRKNLLITSEHEYVYQRFDMLKTLECEVRDLNPRSRASEARTLTRLG